MNRIMVVDDEEELLDVLEIMLDDEQFEVIKAQSGAQCLEKIRESPVDLILMDVRMPGMDGWETVRKLKEDGVTKDTKIIMLTVEKGPGVEIFGLQDVVSDYVTKPVDRDNLIGRVRKALQE